MDQIKKQKRPLFFNGNFSLKTIPAMLGFLFIGMPLPAQEKFERQGAKVIVGKARFTVLTPECVRLEYSENGKFVDAKSLFAVHRDAGFNDFKVTQQQSETVIDTGKIKLIYSPDGKTFSPQNLKALISKGKDSIAWTPGQKNIQNLGGTIQTLDQVKQAVDLGEGLLSRDGWYVIDDSKNNLYTEDWVEPRPKESGIDWYLFGYGDDYKAGLKSLTAIGGKIPMPRKYVLGAWYSRYWPYSSADYRQIIKEYQEHDFPLDIIVLDMDWHKDGWTGWSWNRKLLPDAEELLKWFHEQKLYVTLNVHPADGIQKHEDMYEAFMKEMGKDPVKDEPIPFDVGNKKYLDALFKHTHTPLEKSGVDFWWLDWQQYQFARSIPTLPNLWWLNDYYYQHTSQNNLRGQSFSRWGGWGDHRHPIQFSGDAHTGWAALAFEVPFTCTAGNVGCFFWSHDLGGHMGPRNEESYTRWVQFGTVTASLRSHSTRSKDLDRRPWNYTKEAEQSMHVSFHLRSMLFPYIYSSVWECSKESLPLNRPMYLEYPTEEKAYKNPQQFLFGDAFLAAPIVTPGTGPGKVAQQTVWFPDGTWYNWFTGEKFSGPDEALVSADLDEFPLYVKAGIPIPMQPYRSRMASEPLTELIVRVYPGEDGKSGTYALYEDDGISRDYEKGGYAVTDLNYLRQGDEVTVTISPAKGSYKGQVKSRSIIVELSCTEKADKVEVNGKVVSVQYDSETWTNRVTVPSSSIAEQIIVKAKLKSADFAAISRKAMRRRMRGLLGDGVAMASLDEAIVQSAAKMNGDSSVVESLMALGGAGLHIKNEALYLYKGKPKFLLYNDSAHLIDGDAVKVSLIDYIGDKSSEVFSGNYKVNGTMSPLSVEIASAPLAVPPVIGARAERNVQVDFKVKGQPISVVKTVERTSTHLKDWSIVGPFEFDPKKKISEQKYAPEENHADLTAVYKGLDGKNVGWTKAECDSEGMVNLRNYFDYENKIAYAVTHLHADKERKAVILINTDDGVEAWLNGEKIHSINVGRPVDHEPPDIVKATLKAGENTLLLKVSQYAGGWAFRVRVEGE